MEDHSFPPTSGTLTSKNVGSAASLTIPPQLKFLISNIKSTVVHPLSPDTYQIWHSQIFKLFKANDYEGFLTGEVICPPKPTGYETPTSENNANYTLWNLIDHPWPCMLPSPLPFFLM